MNRFRTASYITPDYRTAKREIKNTKNGSINKTKITKEGKVQSLIVKSKPPITNFAKTKETTFVKPSKPVR